MPLKPANKENWEEFSYFTFDGNGNLVMGELSDIPEEIKNYWTIQESFDYLVLSSSNQLNRRKINYKLAVAALKWYWENFGQEFPVLYRGINATNQDSKQDGFIFTTPNIDIAKMYGKTIKEYKNTKGIAFKSKLKSVLTDDWSEPDIEVIVFL